MEIILDTCFLFCKLIENNDIEKVIQVSKTIELLVTDIITSNQRLD